MLLTQTHLRYLPYPPLNTDTNGSNGSTPCTVRGNYLAPDYPCNPDTAWVLKLVYDFNRDGHRDIIFQNSNTAEVVVWYLNGTGGFKSGIYNISQIN